MEQFNADLTLAALFGAGSVFLVRVSQVYDSFPVLQTVTKNESEL